MPSCMIWRYQGGVCKDTVRSAQVPSDSFPCSYAIVWLLAGRLLSGYWNPLQGGELSLLTHTTPQQGSSLITIRCGRIKASAPWHCGQDDSKARPTLSQSSFVGLSPHYIHDFVWQPHLHRLLVFLAPSPNSPTSLFLGTFSKKPGISILGSVFLTECNMDPRQSP